MAGATWQAARRTRVRFPPGTVLLYVYFAALVVKKWFGVGDGLVDALLLSIAGAYVGVRSRNLRQGARTLLRLNSTKALLAMVAYFIMLGYISGGQLGMMAAEFPSVFKWMLYYLLGVWLGTLATGTRVDLFARRHLLVVTLVVAAYSCATYNWAGFGLNTAGFYDNSYESIFSLRSVFALFALCILAHALRSRIDVIGLILIVCTAVFIYMAGNRKALIVVLVLLLAISGRSTSMVGALRYLRYMAVAFVIAIVPYTSLYVSTVLEYSSEEQPRVFAYMKAIEIATDYFPIGSGPGTFASAGSIVNYSKIYYQYDMSRKWGFGETDETRFHNDTYWAQIIGQYGFIGILLVLAMLFWVYREASAVDRLSNERLGYRYLILMAVLLSVVTPSLQRTEVSLFIFMAIGFKRGALQRLERIRRKQSATLPPGP